MKDEKYTERDIELAEKLGGLTASVQHIHDKLDAVLADQQKTTTAIWKRIDEHSSKFDDHQEKISKLDGAFKWMIGIGLGFQAAWGILMVWLKKN